MTRSIRSSMRYEMKEKKENLFLHHDRSRDDTASPNQRNIAKLSSIHTRGRPGLLNDGQILRAMRLFAIDA